MVKRRRWAYEKYIGKHEEEEGHVQGQKWLNPKHYQKKKYIYIYIWDVYGISM